MGIKGLRNGAIFTFFGSMGILLVGGHFAKERVPPIPEKVVRGETLLTDRAAIMRGQDVYQRYGLMDHGSVWGAWVAPWHGFLGPHTALRGRVGEAKQHLF